MNRHFQMKIAVLLFLCALCAASTNALAQAAQKPVVGDRAPLVQGIDQDGKVWKLSELVGKKVVLLYFYPKDETPGCTKQACGLRDSIAELQKEDVSVVGVSFDSAESHRQFIAKHNLNFTLLADAEGKIVDAYGVRMVDKQRARRVSFLVGKDGKIIHVTDSPEPEKHLSEIKAAVAQLK